MRRLILAAAGAMAVAAAAACSGGESERPAEPGGTAAATETPSAARPLAVVAVQSGSEDTPGRSYPLLEVVSFDAATGDEAARFQAGGRDDFLTPGMVFLAGREVVTVGEKRVVRRALDGRELGVLMDWREDQRPTTAALSHDGRLLAIGWEDAGLRDRENGGLIVFEVATGRVVREWGMDVFGPAVGAWPAPEGWHADDLGLEVFGFAHRDGPGVFASVRLDGSVARRGPIVAGIEPGGRLMATAPGGWTWACMGIAIAARELVFADPVTGREAGRAGLDGFAFWPMRFAPGADAVLLEAYPVRPAPTGGECYAWQAGAEVYLFTFASGKLERVPNPGAIAAGWNDPALPSKLCASNAVDAGPWAEVRDPRWAVFCEGGAEVRLGGKVVLRAEQLQVLGIAPGD
ncbi:hypothetical protein [Tepidiforma sp.]|jgi:hypothetical protein|uniref:hypothetical protein n=1 Tax=Tepidiforma sp. TaxID=2682230 RepID=UPI00261D7D9B|nr:hypothetical protein [Tepidiforma sp.]MCX7616933.1 hypothetical protein [Tepidiforma sp.]